MSDTVTIRNKSSETRHLDELGDEGVVEPGATVDVPAELANGTPPSGKEGDPEYHPGSSGLLAQEDVWEKATSKRTDKTPAGEEA